MSCIRSQPSTVFAIAKRNKMCYRGRGEKNVEIPPRAQLIAVTRYKYYTPFTGKTKAFAFRTRIFIYIKNILIYIYIKKEGKE